jgi:hypothetical protein
MYFVSGRVAVSLLPGLMSANGVNTLSGSGSGY